METFWEILKYTLPALILLIAAFFMLKGFFKYELQKYSVDLKKENQKIIVPLRLQAYERMILFLERISPQNLTMRIYNPSISMGQFQILLLKTIRDEFEHNLSQQLYISTHAWELIKIAKEDSIKLINLATTKLKDNAGSNELSQIIIGLAPGNTESVQRAIDALKDDIKRYF